MTQYMGIDWLAICLTFPAIHLLNHKQRKGYLLMMVGNLCWFTIGLQADSYAMTFANLGFLSMNLHGYVRWSNAEA
jgi:nicotinamide riboside transporter PnuC